MPCAKCERKRLTRGVCAQWCRLFVENPSVIFEQRNYVVEKSAAVLVQNGGSEKSRVFAGGRDEGY